MKHALFIFIALVTIDKVNSQSIVTTSTSKSGILVGSTTDFAGINYENANDKFSFNYKFTNQDRDTSKGNEYPNFWGINIGAGIKIEKGKASLVNNEKWQGGVDFDVTAFRTWDDTKTLEIKDTENGITHKRANIKQKTLYIKFSNALERFKSFESIRLNQDTTFITLNNPLQNNFILTPGYYTMHQWKSNWFFSYAVSANINFINNSTRKLSEKTLIPYSGLLLNSIDSTQIFQTAKQETYFSGKSEFEIFFVPRADVFLRYRLGEKKPVVGLLASYSPLVSSFESVKTRNSFSFGPTFGLDTFPDQVIFAIMNEFNQNKTGEYKYALTFQASFPIRFK
jgi:hypothetical protein